MANQVRKLQGQVTQMKRDKGHYVGELANFDALLATNEQLKGDIAAKELLVSRLRTDKLIFKERAAQQLTEWQSKHLIDLKKFNQKHRLLCEQTIAL